MSHAMALRSDGIFIKHLSGLKSHPPPREGGRKNRRRRAGHLCRKDSVYPSSAGRKQALGASPAVKCRMLTDYLGGGKPPARRGLGGTAGGMATKICRCSPGARSSSRQSPIATRTSRKVGWPTRAVIRRTWRFLPSVMVSSSQLSGICCRTRIGGVRGQTVGDSSRLTCAGRVVKSPKSTPAASVRKASSLGMPSTCTQ